MGLLPWAQEAPGSNPGAPTIYLFICNELSQIPGVRNRTWVQVRASPRFQSRDVVLRLSRASESRA